MTSVLLGALYLSGVVLLHQGSAPLHHCAGLLRDMIPWGRFSRPSLDVAATHGTDEIAARILTTENTPVSSRR